MFVSVLLRVRLCLCRYCYPYVCAVVFVCARVFFCTPCVQYILADVGAGAGAGAGVGGDANDADDIDVLGVHRYGGADSPCWTNASKRVVATMDNYTNVPVNSEAQLEAAVALGQFKQKL